MKLEIAMLAGEESKKLLAGFTAQIDRLEKLLGGKSLAELKPTKVEAEETEETEVADEDEDFAPKKEKPKKKAVSFDEDDEAESEEAVETEAAEETDEDDDEGFKSSPKKKPGRKKKVTADDVNDACKNRALAGGKAGRGEVLAILKKKFKTDSVSELEPEQYEACIEAMAVEQ